jgi:hypothetical protein
MASPTSDRRLALQVGVAIKAPVQCCSTTNITLSGAQTIDGYSASLLDATGYPSRVLVTGQTVASENGIYDVGVPWTLSPDSDGPNDLQQGTFVVVANGNANSGLWWCTTANPIVPGSGQNINFTQFVAL